MPSKEETIELNKRLLRSTERLLYAISRGKVWLQKELDEINYISKETREVEQEIVSIKRELRLQDK